MMRLLTNVGVLCCLSVAMLSAADDPLLGTWKMNVEKSKFSPGPAPKSVTSTYSEEGDWIVIKTDGVDAEGKSIARTNRYKLDGNEYPFEGPNGTGKISIKKIDEYNSEAVMKSEGGGTVNTRSVISKDGKTRTTTSTGTNAKGQKVNSVIVWERQ
jgi:hypothetical protein